MGRCYCCSDHCIKPGQSSVLSSRSTGVEDAGLDRLARRNGMDLARICLHGLIVRVSGVQRSEAHSLELGRRHKTGLLPFAGPQVAEAVLGPQTARRMRLSSFDELAKVGAVLESPFFSICHQLAVTVPPGEAQLLQRVHLCRLCKLSLQFQRILPFSLRKHRPGNRV